MSNKQEKSGGMSPTIKYVIIAIIIVLVLTFVRNQIEENAAESESESETSETTSSDSETADSTTPTEEESTEAAEEVSLIQFNPDGSEINCVMETNYGTIEFMLFPEQAPNAVENFVTLAEEGYYDGLTFHRVIDDFMIQGGDPSGNGTGGEAANVVDPDGNGKFDDEISDELYHFRGAMCYANSGPDTNSSQFYIVQAGPETLRGVTAEELAAEYNLPINVAEKYIEVGGTPHLDGGYTIFGMVTSGMEVVDTIADVETSRNDMPVEPVVIESITVLE